MKASGRLGPIALKLRFRAAVHEQMLHKLAAEHGVQDMIDVCPPLPYKAALQEMLRADVLLVMQAANCNEQIPAKLYEYLRAGRPIVCLSDPRGDTVDVLRRAGIDRVAPLDSAEQIEHLLARVLRGEGLHQLPERTMVAQASRESRSANLAATMDRLLQRPPRESKSAAQ